MDCMTISTFRGLEQQAIRQSREDMRREQLHKVATLLMETFRQEPNVPLIQNSQTPVEPTENSINKKTIDYYI